MKVNALTKRLGGIRVELVDLGDEVIPGRSFADCDPVQGDQFWTTVTWNGKPEMDIDPTAGVVIRFEMDRAKLFGVEFYD